MNPILSTKEAAGFLGTTSQIVRRWCREGYLPAVKIGREYRISTAALVDWWEEQGGGRLDFEAFYSVQKDSKKTDEVLKTDEKKAGKVAKKDSKKTDEVIEKDEKNETDNAKKDNKSTKAIAETQEETPKPFARTIIR